MTLNQLEYFLELSKNCHFSNVAKSLFISQSSLSYSMAELEKDLGVSLFIHQGRRVTLTEAGEEYAKLIEPILVALKDANISIRTFASITSNDVQIGFAQSIYAAEGPKIIRRFYDKPDSKMINLKLSDQKGSRDLVEDILSGKLDLIISPINDENLERVFLFSRPTMLFVPKNHRLYGRDQVSLNEILEEEYISAPLKYPSRQLVDSVFQGAGVTRKIVNEQLTHRSTLTYVAAGLGVAIIPYSPEYSNLDCCAIRINHPRFLIDYYLQWAKNRNPTQAVKYTRSFLLEDCKDIWEQLNK